MHVVWTVSVQPRPRQWTIAIVARLLHSNKSLRSIHLVGAVSMGAQPKKVREPAVRDFISLNMCSGA